MGRRVQCSIYSNQVTSLPAGSFTMVNFHVENFSRSTHPLRRDVISHATTAISYAMWAEIWASEKVEWVEIPVLFFAVCGRKFTKFGTHVGEWFQIDDILFPSGDIRDRITNSEILMFLGRQVFGGRDPLNFWLNLKNYSHHRTCSKVWWWSAQRPPRLGDEKK